MGNMTDFSLDLWHCHEAPAINLEWSPHRQAWLAMSTDHGIAAEGLSSTEAIEALARDVCEQNGWDR